MLNIEFLTWFVVINFIFMSFSHVMISYVYSGYSAFKKMYPGTEDEYKKLLTAIFHIWRLLLFFFGIIPLITLLILD
ncbi:MAG: hypothetical protein CMG47_02480 [Candidatus Marinimicrobia bacterium]|nr:hypothetical protein [Candidatus Neomarinimicrobiota bacterium]